MEVVTALSVALSLSTASTTSQLTTVEEVKAVIFTMPRLDWFLAVSLLTVVSPPPDLSLVNVKNEESEMQTLPNADVKSD